MGISPWKGMVVMDPNLTLEDFDWLREIEAATDATRDPPPIPMNIASKLGAFGFVKSNGLGGLTITDGRSGALLEQKMSDAQARWRYVQPQRLLSTLSCCVH